MVAHTTQAVLFQLLGNSPNQIDFSSIREYQWNDILYFADAHFISPFLFRRIVDNEILIPDQIREKLKLAYLENTGRNLMIFHAFSQLNSQLKQEDIPVIPLKGLYLADRIYPTIGERVIGDLDLLVPKDKIARAVELSIASGYVPSVDLHIDAWLENKHQVCQQFNPKNNISLEWHWHIVSPTKPAQIDIKSLWGRATADTIQNEPVSSLSFEDTILHLAHHISYHHDFLFGLRNLCDLMMICHKFGQAIDWDIVDERASLWHIERGVSLVLMMLRHYFNVSIPDFCFSTWEASPLYLEMAVNQICEFPQQVEQVSLTRQRVLGVSGLFNKMRALKTAVFPTQQQMAIRYGIEPGLMSMLPLYKRRWQSLATQAVQKILNQEQNDLNVTEILHRKKVLASWLYQ